MLRAAIRHLHLLEQCRSRAGAGFVDTITDPER
jgi:hypothetical protein